MKNLVNLRLPVVCAVALAIGVAAGTASAFYGIEVIAVFAAVPAAAVIFIIFVLMKRSALSAAVALALVFFLVGAVGCRIYADKFLSYEISEGRSYGVVGVVREKGATDYGEYIIIDDVTADGLSLDGKTRVYLGSDYGEYCAVGYRVAFDSQLYACDLFSYGKVSYNAVAGVRYTAYVYGGLMSEYATDFFTEARNAVENALCSNLSSESAAVVSAMLLGGTDGIEEGILQNFRYGGVAHIFAVSGLHIGIVYGIILFIMKKLRANKYLTAAVCLGFVLLYAGVCGFTLSSVRATVMCGVACLARLTRSKYDGLNSLAVAVIIILLICPFNMYSTGFKLSVCAVGGIVLLSKNISRLLRKLKAPQKLSAAVGVSFGAQLGVMPVMLSEFGYISGAGLLLNLLLIPLLSVLFSLIFICTLVSAAIPAVASVAVPVSVLPLELLLSFLVGTGFENALITGFGAGLFFPLFIALLIILSDKLDLTAIRRTAAFLTVSAILVCYVLVRTYAPFNLSVTVMSKNGECVLIKSSAGTVLVVCEDAGEEIFVSLSQNYSVAPDGVIILGGEPYGAAELPFGCEIYVSDSLFPLRYDGVNYVGEFELCGVCFEFIDEHDLLARYGGVSVGISFGNVAIESCDLLICEYENDFCDAAQTAYFKAEASGFNAYGLGDMTFLLVGGGLKYFEFLPL